MNDITTTRADSAAQKAAEYLDAMGLANGLRPAQKTQFIEICTAYQLNPFKREIYGVKYGDNFNIIVGYEVYLKRAERSGKLDGWHKETVGAIADGTLASTITIYRKDWSRPFQHTAYFSEFNGQSPLWKKSPRFMLEKVASAQAFRLAFPDELGGIPYTQEETSLFSDGPTPPSDSTGGYAILAGEVKMMLDADVVYGEQLDMMREEFAAASSAGDTYGMQQLHATMTTILNERIERGLAAVYPSEIAISRARAKYPDKLVLLAHLIERAKKKSKPEPEPDATPAEAK